MPAKLFLSIAGARAPESCFRPFTVAMPKTKELCYRTDLSCLPYPPPAAQSSNWMCSVKVTVPKTPQKQQAHFFTISSVLGSAAHETSHSNIWMRKEIESFEKQSWNAINVVVAKCPVAKRVEVSGRRLLFSVKETLQNGHKMEQAVAGGWVPPTDWDTLYFARMLWICRLSENGTRWLYDPF